MADKMKNKTKKAVKKAVKKNPKGFVFAVVAVILVIAITFAVIYFAFPDAWNGLMDMVIGDTNDKPDDDVQGGGVIGNPSDGSQDDNTDDDVMGNPSDSNKGDNAGDINHGGNTSGGTLTLGEGELVINFVDVGQADCAIILFPDDKTMIIDGGDKGSKDDVLEAMDRLGVTSFDYVLLTHTDADHCGSLDDAINKAEEVENVYLPKIKSKDYDLGLSSGYKTVTTIVYNDFVKSANEATYFDDNGEEQSANLIFTEDKLEIVADDNSYKMTMYCRSDEYYKSMKVSAHDLNDVSPICILEYNGRKVVFAGDSNALDDGDGGKIGTSSEQNFLNALKAEGYTDETFDADILKVGHHGAKYSSGADFLDFIDVEYAIVSVGGSEVGTDEEDTYYLYINEELATATDYEVTANKKYGHPTGAVCAEGGRLQASGVEFVYYTWWNGNVTCTIDGEGTIEFECEIVAKLVAGEVVFESATA